MFGTWRLLLALEVVIHHLLSAPITGRYAVISFFVLSGFLMTTIMQKTYGYSPKGFAAYAANRALRLYPNLWFACLVSLAVIFWIGEGRLGPFHSAMFVPGDASAWIQNFSLIFFDWVPISVVPRLSPPTWALTVELFFYAAIGLGLSRRSDTTLAWLAASLIYTAWALIFDMGERSVYGSIIGGSLPFAMGSAIYHYREWLERLLAKLSHALAILVLGRWAFMLAMMIAYLMGYDGWRVSETGNVLNAALSALIVVELFSLKLSGRWRKLDSLLGDFSYPVYLLHFQAGAIATYLLFGEAIRRANVESFLAFPLTLIVLTILALVSVLAIDPAVKHVRDHVRRSASKGPETKAVAAADPP